jgi:hypothetical protein
MLVLNFEEIFHIIKDIYAGDMLRDSVKSVIESLAATA